MLSAAASTLLATLAAFSATRDVRLARPCPEDWHVRIDHRYGSVVIAGRDQDSVELRARISAEADDAEVARLLADEMVGVSIAARGETLVIATRYPRDFEPTSELGYGVDLALVVPAGVRLEASTQFGDLTVSDITGSCRVSNRFGRIDLDRCADADVTGRYSDVRVSGSRGSLAVRNSFGDVKLDDVSDLVTVDNRYGNLHSEGASGEVQLGNRFGSIVARRSAGRVMVINQYGDIETWVDDSALAELNVLAELGRIQLNVARQIPWQLGGRTVRGLIRSALPLKVLKMSEGQEVRGASGSGGPRIGVMGSWADILIQPVAARPEGRETE